ncbi:MAG: PIG-L family deacetylase [Catenulisporales bacterium]|nr:PIG-L family deacetylase [Catenulisporales bacterium]
MSRRELGLLGMGALALGTFGADSTVSRSDDEQLARPARLAGRVAFLQVVAHPDDDLYFMNPDIADSVRTGGEVTTVVLTAAEAAGGAQFSAARQHGLRSAYARMAGVEDDAPWRSSALVTRGGEANLCELRANPRVRLVFLDISMGGYGGDVAGDENYTPLAALYHGAVSTRPVLRPRASGPTKWSSRVSGLTGRSRRGSASARRSASRRRTPAPSGVRRRWWTDAECCTCSSATRTSPSRGGTGIWPRRAACGVTGATSAGIGSAMVWPRPSLRRVTSSCTPTVTRSGVGPSARTGSRTRSAQPCPRWVIRRLYEP